MIIMTTKEEWNIKFVQIIEHVVYNDHYIQWHFHKLAIW
jgi:hypothetical protein